MNLGPVGEVGAFGRAVVEAMRSQPVVLMVLIFNVAFMGLIAYSTHDNNQRWERMVNAVLNCQVK